MRTLAKLGELWRTLANPRRYIHENLPDIHQSSGEGPPHSPEFRWRCLLYEGGLRNVPKWFCYKQYFPYRIHSPYRRVHQDYTHSSIILELVSLLITLTPTLVIVFGIHITSVIGSCFSDQFPGCKGICISGSHLTSRDYTTLLNCFWINFQKFKITRHSHFISFWLTNVSQVPPRVLGRAPSKGNNVDRAGLEGTIHKDTDQKMLAVLDCLARHAAGTTAPHNMQKPTCKNSNMQQKRQQ